MTILQRVSRASLAWLGLALIITPLYFVTAAILKYAFGVGLLFDPLATFFADPERLRFLNLVLTPLLFFGGSLVALALNFYAIVGHGKGTPADHTNRKSRFWNLVVVLISASLLMVLTTYGYLENFTHR